MKTIFQKSAMNQALAGVALVASMAAGQAIAAPIVTWDYTLSSMFTSATFTSGPDVTTSTTTLSWGDPAAPNTQQSSLVINPATVNGTVNTFVGDGTPPAEFIATGNTLTHNNFPIFAPTLTSAVLRSELNLVDPGNSPNPGAQTPMVIDIAFAETPNVTNCGFPSGSSCDDIFVITSSPFLNETFTYLGVDYFINVFPTSGGVLGTLPVATCTAAGQSAGCVGFQTQENQSTSLPFGFTISTKPLTQMPEPGTLALISLGLVGAGFIGRRKSL